MTVMVCVKSEVINNVCTKMQLSASVVTPRAAGRNKTVAVLLSEVRIRGWMVEGYSYIHNTGN